MKRTIRAVIVLAIVGGLVAAAALYLHHANVAVLEPKGVVGRQERQLMELAAILSVVVVVPVFAMTAAIVWRYRAGNKKAKYSPELDGNRAAEATWWLIPTVIILMLSVVTWNSSHALDPFRPLNSTVTPMTIDAVALNWKWLFIYPEQHIATVNFVQFPTNVPVTFNITADAPMNSFWIPQLGGQMYAMPGMSTQLHLMADANGDYRGSSANISGQGFAQMVFTAHASSTLDFDAWVQTVRHSSQTLNMDTYDTLAQPSQNNPRAYYANADAGLYNDIIMKYMMPMPGVDPDRTGLQGMAM